MACVISISSDEEEFEDASKPSKRIKLDCPEKKDNNNGIRSNIIVLDDDEDDNKGAKLTCKNDVKKLNNFKRLEPRTLTEIIETVKETKSVKKSFAKNAMKDCDAIESENADLTQNMVQNANENVDDFQSSIQVNQNINDDLIEPEKDIKSGPSSCKVTDNFKNCKQMQELIDVCLAHIENSETRSLFKSKIPIFKILFNQVDEDYIKSEAFKKELEKKITLSKSAPYVAVQNFNDIYKLLKTQKKYASSGTLNTDTKNDKIIRKLDHTLSKLRKRIKELEDEEINFDEQEDSSYIKMFRYQERAVKIFEKLCKYLNEDPHYDNIMYNRLDFSGSRLPEFNKAINRKYKNNMVFPTYYEVECCLKKCVDSNNMAISESAFKAEARYCFEKLGNLIQYRRKMELLEAHSFFVPSNQDPAANNSELNSKLQSHYENAKSKIDEICEKYSHLQDTSKNPELSTDSDDSNMQLSEDETER